MPVPNASELHDLVIAAFGQRGGDGRQAPTVAVGFLSGQQGLYVAKQGGPVPDGALEKLMFAWKAGGYDVKDFADADKIIESRYLATTGRKLSQWTGYHAEMIVLSAMLCANAWDPKKIANIGGKLAEAGGALICANATACHHCGELMDSLKVAYYGDKGEKSNTAWWNPLTDAVIQKDGAGW